jgi:putative cell wall-binding protein
MQATVIHGARSGVAPFLALILACASLLGTPTSSAGAACEMLVSALNVPPTSDASIPANELATFAGTGFSPNVDVVVEYFRDGFLFESTTDTTNASGAWSLNRTFLSDDLGDWHVVATDAGTPCTSAVDVTILPSANTPPPPAGCLAEVTSDAVATPGPFRAIVLGESVYLHAEGFTPNSFPPLEFIRNGLLIGQQGVSADGSGHVDVEITFDGPTDIAFWNLHFGGGGPCFAGVYVAVLPNGPVGTVLAATFVCPPGIQSRAQVQAGGPLACKVGVLTEEGTIPPPGHTHNLASVDFDYELTASDDLVFTLDIAELDGGGMCGPTSCTYGFSYRWEFVSQGLASLQISPPNGYRFGFAQVQDVLDPPDPEDPLSVDPSTGTITFNVPEDDFVQSLMYVFADWGTSRMAGANRYATAAAISAGTFDGTVPVAYIANGLNFPDALAGAVPAALDGGPLLLTNPTSLPNETTAELNRIDPGRIVILGGTASVSNAVQVALDAYTTGPVDRLAGPNRFATAAAISAATFSPGVPVAYVANGLNFPDALAGAVPAAIEGGPLLLTSPGTLPAETIAELTRLNPGRIVVLGGLASVSSSVATALEAFTAGAVDRLAGANRFATAAAVSAATFAPGVPVAYVANGLNFPDALAGAVPAALMGGPLLLTSPTSLPNETKAELTRLNPGRIVVLGGIGSVSNAVQAVLNGYADPAP